MQDDIIILGPQFPNLENKGKSTHFTGYCGDSVAGSNARYNTCHSRNAPKVLIGFSISISWGQQHSGKLIYGLSFGDSFLWRS